VTSLSVQTPDLDDVLLALTGQGDTAKRHPHWCLCRPARLPT